MIEVIEYRKKEVEVDYDWKDDKIVVNSVKDLLTNESLKYFEKTIMERLEVATFIRLHRTITDEDRLGCD